ncbi:hypothetical protein [Streptomyces sp. NPDC046976]|uniref:hypothetical protein n=1 Tax=Streptomyces sp. NPDC046976 TaxID=3155258 RepID=UPI0033F3B445
MSPQRYFRVAGIDLLVSGLRRTLPSDMRVAREMTVVLDKHNGPEPDICVVRGEALTDQTTPSSRSTNSARSPARTP